MTQIYPGTRFPTTSVCMSNKYSVSYIIYRANKNREREREREGEREKGVGEGGEGTYSLGKLSSTLPLVVSRSCMYACKLKEWWKLFISLLSIKERHYDLVLL